MQQSRVQGVPLARMLKPRANARASRLHQHSQRLSIHAHGTSAVPAGDLTGPTLLPTSDASPVPKLQPSVHMIGANKSSVRNMAPDASLKAFEEPSYTPTMAGAPVQHKDNTVGMFGKTASAIQIINAWCMQHWCMLSAFNTAIASVAAFMASQPGASNILLLGAFSTSVMFIALKMVQFSVSCFLQGLKGLRIDQKSVLVMEEHLTALMNMTPAQLQPDAEEQPTPTSQFFLSGTIVTLVACCLSNVVKDCLQLYPEFEVSQLFTVVPTAWGALALICGVLACLMSLTRGLWTPQPAN